MGVASQIYLILGLWAVGSHLTSNFDFQVFFVITLEQPAQSTFPCIIRSFPLSIESQEKLAMEKFFLDVVDLP